MLSVAHGKTWALLFIIFSVSQFGIYAQAQEKLCENMTKDFPG